MKRALFCLLLGATGCQDDMPDMMQDDPTDAGRPDAPVDMADASMPEDAAPVDVAPVDIAPPDAS